MNVRRIVPDVSTQNPSEADSFYGDLLGLELAMDSGWIRTYMARDDRAVQISFASQGGSGAPVPDLSIEVDDLSQAISRFQDGGIEIEYGPVSEPWGVRRFFVRDPFGRLVNILQHE